MYIDETVEVRADLPKELLDDFIELRKHYEADEWFEFGMLFELVEARTKAYYLAGKIGREDLELIFKKYGSV